MPDPNSVPLFRCKSCIALYQVVKAQGGPETVDPQIACRVCNGPLAARDGQFVLKYFLLREASRLDARRALFSLTWSRQETDQRVETATAFPAVPNMTGALIAPVLRPFGGDQLTTALNAFHPEAGTRVGTSHPHVSLHTFAST
jgi:hypothetical protein